MLQCANKLTSWVFKVIRLMEFSIQTASIGTPTKINLLYQISQKVDNATFRRIWLSFGMEAYDHTHTVYTQNTRPQHTVYRHTKHSAIRTLRAETQNTRPHAHGTQKNKTLGHTYTVYRHTKHSTRRTLRAETQNTRPHAHCLQTNNTNPTTHVSG